MNDEGGPFDIIIVGAGPSAAGLLRGLLQRSLAHDKDGIRIAILERGGGGGSTTTGSNEGRDEGVGVDGGRGGKRSRFDHPHPSTECLSRWFEASHYSSTITDYVVCRRHDDGDVATTPPQSPTVLHATVPNRSTNYRVMDVPTGRGWGGSTNVNAGLVMEPIWSSMSSFSEGGASHHGRNDDREEKEEQGGGDFDAPSWPGMWRGGEALRSAVREVRSALVIDEEGEEEERCGADPCCQNELGEGYLEFLPVIISTSTSSSFDSRIAKQTNDFVNSIKGEMEEVVAAGKAEHGTSSRSYRLNYFAALVEPLLRLHPKLEDRVVFMPGTRAERIMLDRSGRAWGVECLLPTDGVHRIRQVDARVSRKVLLSRGEIVLCAGSIGSPALLLASGVGHEDDLREAGIVPWYECRTNPPEDAPSSSSSSFHRTLPVGRNLRDHVLLPRVFVSNDRPHLRRWTSSCNSIQATTTIDLPVYAFACGSSSTKTRDRRARIQFQLADGGMMDHMIPHFAAAAMRRMSRSSSRSSWLLSSSWSLWSSWSSWSSSSSSTVDDQPGMSSSARWWQSYYYYYPLRSLLRLLIRLSPFRNAARQRISAINVCLMNPRSVGRVTVVCRRDNDDDVNDEEFQDRKGQSSDPNTVPTRECHSRSFPTRLSNCRVIIDPGYLTDPWDVDALWAGFCVSSEIKRRMFGGCTEILPGHHMAVVSSLVSSATSLIGWLMSHFWHGKLAEMKERRRRRSDRPSWFSVYVAEFANPFYHWCGSCAMGEDAIEDADAAGQHVSETTGRDESIHSGDCALTFVVDERLRVRGTVGLRVCDASVFPACISAPTALTCAALGHAASAFILDSDQEVGQANAA
ncbi:hypothetical protein ACHAXA_001155 [Cyclostephanos tholiformis]|uniref:Glucose-methanol-choline oxidoreductase N-terminal domain-containing protein n=1 Tax=Cyclostephanos tholiformis TaxID=382380 RepID=A0ABD3RCL9_9STRA